MLKICTPYVAEPELLLEVKKDGESDNPEPA